MGATGARTPPSKLTLTVFGVSVIAAIWALAMMTTFGRVAYFWFFWYSEYYMGVLSLVSLSITIMLGLVATDRLVLSIRQRVLLQSAHRTFGVIAVGALFLHLWTKLVESHIRIIDIFIPFLMPYNTLFVGLGTLSAWIMVLSMWTGIVRSKFIGRGKPWMWRSIHALSYLMWPIALVHGLSAGRAAATWVVVSYVVCILGVLLGLAVRISVSLNRKKDFASQAGTGTGGIKPVGQLVPTTAAVLKKRPGRRAEPDLTGVRVDGGSGAPAAVLDRWQPAAPPVRETPVSAAPAMTGPPPISAPPYAEESPRRGRSRRGAETGEAAERRPRRNREDAARARYADDDAPRPRRGEPAERYEPTERFDEQTRSVSRRAIGSGRPPLDDDDPPRRPRRRVSEEPAYETQRYDPEPRRTRRYADEEAPRRARAELEAPRPRRGEEGPRRYAEDEAPRARRYAEDEAPRARRYAEDEGPRARRYADEAPPRARRDDVDRADSGRHSRSEFVDLADEDYQEPDETPTLIDMASRRARRTTAQQDGPRGAGRGARRARGRDEDAVADDDRYWRQLRGEAQ